jgi:hypothetical protein
MRFPITLVMLLACLLPLVAQEKSKAQPRKTVLGTTFLVDPQFDKLLADNVAKARKAIKEQREQGKLIAYLSVPISARGGGHEATNKAISHFTRARLEVEFGGRLWVLDPAEFQIAKPEGKSPDGGDYLWMWTEILAGVDGKGSDFDMVYFQGPSDVSSFFRHYRGSALVDKVEDYLEVTSQQKGGEAFRKFTPAQVREFVRFYALRASVAYSKGAHDEWNLFVKINKKRGVGEQIPCYYDGRSLSPAEMETEITPGYEVR